MSFILDALKKSEQERHQGQVPTLQTTLEPASPAKRRIWPFLVGGALLVGAGMLVGWLWMGPRQPAPLPVAAAPAARSAPLPVPSAAPAPVPSPPPSVAGGAPTPAPPAALSTPAPSAPSAVARPVPAPEPVAVARPVQETRQASPPSPPPVRAAAPQASPTAKGAVVLDIKSLPPGVRSRLPALDLQLHFYTQQAERRLIRLNGANLRQGDAAEGGLTVEKITVDGVILSFEGGQFLLRTGRP